MSIAGNAKTLEFLAAYLRMLLTPMVHWPETMMTFEETERVDLVNPEVLMPSHGPAWDGNADIVRGWYERWSRYAVAEGCAEAGLRRIALHDVSRTHPSYILADLWRYGAGGRLQGGASRRTYCSSSQRRSSGWPISSFSRSSAWRPSSGWLSGR